MNAVRTPNYRLNDSGIVSIVVTMIIMVILSLIVIGFAQVSRREQRQGLDRQLASQANYAAETGINDAQTYLKNGGNLSASAKTACNSYAADNGNALPAGVTEQVGPNATTTTSCVLVNNAVNELIYDGIGTEEEVVFPLKSSDGGAISDLYISWEAPGQDATQYNAANCPDKTPRDALLPLDDWKCPAAALRIDIVPTSGSVARTDLINNSVSGLLFPKINASAPSNSEHMDNGKQVWAECPNNGTSPRSCRITLKAIGTSSSYYVRIRPIYRSADIYVQGIDSSGNIKALSGAQAVIDSTGKANDVLKRLVARVPLCGSGTTCGKQPAGYALQIADSFCKKYGIIPPSTINVEDTDTTCALP